jgi:RNA polymerase sigma factor (sigma-70 family)
MTDAAGLVAGIERWIVRQACRLSRLHADDLAQEGRLAAWAMAGRYDPARGFAFLRFAGTRVRGAMVDYLRRQGWIVKAARPGRTLYRRVKLRAVACPSGFDPADLDAAGAVRAVVARLDPWADPRAVGMLEAYYRDGMVLSEIGAAFGVTESGASAAVRRQLARLAGGRVGRLTPAAGRLPPDKVRYERVRRAAG